MAHKNQVILLCVPPHTTHALQPLDVAVFKALKAHFSRALRVCCFTKKNFIVKEPLEFAFSMVNIKSGFSKCGVLENALSIEKMAPPTIYQKDPPPPNEVAASLSGVPAVHPHPLSPPKVSSWRSWSYSGDQKEEDTAG